MTKLIILLIIPIGYYTITYGINVWKNEKNVLGGAAVIALSTLSTLVSIIFIIIRS